MTDEAHTVTVTTEVSDAPDQSDKDEETTDKAEVSEDTKETTDKDEGDE